MDVKDLTTRDLCSQALHIMTDYHRAKLECMLSKESNEELYQSNCYKLRFLNNMQENLSAKQFLLAVDSVINTLDNDLRDIFVELYVNKRRDSIWYLDNLSRSTFYRYRRRALEEFLYYF